MAKKRQNQVPRKRRPLKDGSGKGQGQPGGARRERNEEECLEDGPGSGQGGGRGEGKGRKGTSTKKRLELAARLHNLETTGSAFLASMLESRISETIADLKKLSSLAKESKKVKESDEVDATEKIVYSAVIHAGWMLHECTVVLEALMKDPKKAYSIATKMKRRYKVPS